MFEGGVVDNGRGAVLAALVFMASCSGRLFAQALPADPLERQCWLSFTDIRMREDSADSRRVSFSFLRDGYEVYSPFQVDFSVFGMGVTPAGVIAEGTGHHHILINTPLPLDVREKIPFSDTHKHFGKGQTGGQLSLPVGTHKLRLLFADHDHRPYYVYSREVSIVVKGTRADAPVLKIDPQRFKESCARWYQNQITKPRAPGDLVYVKNLLANEPVKSPFTLKFGVDGYGVCSRAAKAEKAGRFVFEILNRSNKIVQRTDLNQGQTQALVELADGAYILRLQFLDSANRELLPSSELQLKVASR
jgi:hypothetical protein